jgi:hypothetical protein
MRSRSEFAKILTMFKTEAMKSFSQMYSSISSYTDHRRLAKKDASYEKLFDADKKRIGRNVASYAVSATWVAALSILFSELYNIGKDDDEEVGEKMVKEVIGSAFDMIPIVSDISAFMIDGYDVDSIPLEVVNDALNMFRGIGTAFDSGKSKGEKLAYLRSSIYTVGKMVGLPLQNTYKLARTAVSIASRPTLYRMDNTFDKNPSYKSDLEKALEKGNIRLAQTVMSLYMDEKVNGKTSNLVIEELTRLYAAKGEDGKRLLSLPRSAPSDLSTKESARFNEVYSGAEAELVKLIKSAQYRKLDDAGKAAAIKACYKRYYDLAKQATSKN